MSRIRDLHMSWFLRLWGFEKPGVSYTEPQQLHRSSHHQHPGESFQHLMWRCQRILWWVIWCWELRPLDAELKMLQVQTLPSLSSRKGLSAPGDSVSCHWSLPRNKGVSGDWIANLKTPMLLWTHSPHHSPRERTPITIAWDRSSGAPSWVGCCKRTNPEMMSCSVPRKG